MGSESRPQTSQTRAEFLRTFAAEVSQQPVSLSDATRRQEIVHNASSIRRSKERLFPFATL